MPRRTSPDPLAKAIGQRIRQLRLAQQLTQEQLAYESELGSKGHLSDIEAGLVMPTAKTLKVIAEHLGVHLMDVVCFPNEDERQALVDRLRSIPPARIRRLLRELGR